MDIAEVVGCWVSTDGMGAVLLRSVLGTISHSAAKLKVLFRPTIAEMKSNRLLSLFVGHGEHRIELHACGDMVNEETLWDRLIDVG